MLEGLEITEMLLSEVYNNNEKKRIDSGYFSKPMLTSDFMVRCFPGGYDELGKVFSRFSKGIFDIKSDTYTDSGIPFLRISNLKNGLIDKKNLAFISESAHENQKKTELKKSDIVLSKTGYPSASIVTLDQCNASQDTIVTTLSSYGRKSYLPEFIVMYLNSLEGKRLLWRQFQGNVQLHLSLDDGRKVPIPRFGMEIQKLIKLVFDKSMENEKLAIEHLKKSELVLAESLGLSSWEEPVQSNYIRKFSDVFNSERLDAEHFLPKYSQLVELIEKTGDAKMLGQCLDLNQRGKQPKYSEIGLPVINSKHVQAGSVTLNVDNRCALHDDKTLLIKQGDVLINGTGVGTIGRSSPYLHEGNAIPDNHVTILRPKEGLDPVYLSVFLNSIAGQLQVEQWFRGSSGQIELYPIDIARFKIWVAPEDIQGKIRQAVSDSYVASQKSKELLGVASKSVEIAIEESEKEAIKYLKGYC